MIVDSLTKLKVDSKLKRMFSTNILNAKLFFQHTYTKVTNNKFKKLRFTESDVTDNSANDENAEQM